MLGLRQAGSATIPDELIRSATGLGGGCGGQREICGALIAGVQAIGVKYGRTDKSVDRQPAMERSARLVQEFKSRFGTAGCADLVQGFCDFNSPERKQHCARFVSFVAQRVAQMLEEK